MFGEQQEERKDVQSGTIPPGKSQSTFMNPQQGQCMCASKGSRTVVAGVRTRDQGNNKNRPDFVGAVQNRYSHVESKNARP